MHTQYKESDMFHILVYGIERLDYSSPKEKVVINKIELTFAPFDTELKFQNFNGVILFQGIWARWKSSNHLYGNNDDYLVEIQNDMLRVRVKQLQLLLSKGGFISFLMGRMSYNDFDLAKEVLGWSSITNFKQIPDHEFFRKIYFSELTNYFNSDYGVSKTKFNNYSSTDYRVLADISQYDGDVAVCLKGQIFFLPCHVIKKGEKNVRDLFKTLVPGLVTTYRKLNQELPNWLNEFQFDSESKYLKEKQILEDKFTIINQKIFNLKQFKKPLILTGKLLIESLVKIMKNGMSLEVTTKDDGYEDLQLWNRPKVENGSVIAIIEAKGVNGNVTREAINQVDDHRERNNFEANFPGILIVNTFIKSSNSIKDKDRPIEQEQIAHALKMGVLIIRTLDLVRAFDLILSKKIKIDKFKNILLKEKGWMEVKYGKITIHN
ncbi:hypothetical protein HYT02_03865 [Candidatus Gottesmanbacteria bacterium]|nr:hypothetical protein [Candidatus Gottesmanbacteria bacterium]